MFPLLNFRNIFDVDNIVLEITSKRRKNQQHSFKDWLMGVMATYLTMCHLISKLMMKLRNVFSFIGIIGRTSMKLEIAKIHRRDSNTLYDT